jgi:hypothetical protein
MVFLMTCLGSNYQNRLIVSYLYPSPINRVSKKDIIKRGKDLKIEDPDSGVRNEVGMK